MLFYLCTDAGKVQKKTLKKQLKNADIPYSGCVLCSVIDAYPGHVLGTHYKHNNVHV